MTLPKDKKIKHEHIESMKLAVEASDIRSIHPDKMEEFAEVSSTKGKDTRISVTRGVATPLFLCHIMG